MSSTRKKLNVDARGRVTIGGLIEGSVSSFEATVENGRIILEPYCEIPAREKWLWDNKKALASVQRGLKQSAQGKLNPAPEDFSKYLDDE